MSEHKVTETITQRDGQSSAHLQCSCGLSMVIPNVRKTPLRVARKQLEDMHKNLPVEDSPESKKSELTELREEIQKEIKKQKKSRRVVLKLNRKEPSKQLPDNSE